MKVAGTLQTAVTDEAQTNEVTTPASGAPQQPAAESDGLTAKQRKNLKKKQQRKKKKQAANQEGGDEDSDDDQSKKEQYPVAATKVEDSK